MNFRVSICLFALAAGLAATGCGGNKPPDITSVTAEPDSVPRGGVAYLRVRVTDPERSELDIRWTVRAGEVVPDSGDSVAYLAPSFDVWDTATVVVTDDHDLTAEAEVEIYVAEGLCGGRPDVLGPSMARLLAADSVRVYYVEEGLDGSDIRWVYVDGSDYDTLVRRPHEILGLVDGGDELLFLERDEGGSEPRLRIMVQPKDGETGPVVAVDFGGRDSVVYDFAASSAWLYVAWLESVDSLYVAHVTAFSRTSAQVVDRYSVSAPVADATTIPRLAVADDEVFFLVTSNDPEQAAVMKLPASGEAQVLVGPDVLSPGTLGVDDRVDAEGGSVFWSERVQGRIGVVGSDGSDPRFLVPAGGAAQDVSLMLAAPGFHNTGERLVWVVPGDLRGMIVPTGDLLLDMDLGFGTIVGLTHNRVFAFYVRDDGGSSQLFRLLIP